MASGTTAAHAAHKIGASARVERPWAKKPVTPNIAAQAAASRKCEP
jgi:hypothetical protein